MSHKPFFLLCAVVLCMAWAGAAVADSARDMEPMATTVGLDALTNQSEVICWAKHIGAGHMVTSEVLKGDAPTDFTVPLPHATLLPKGQMLLLFIADKATWTLADNAAFAVQSTKGYDRVIIGRLNPAQLINNMSSTYKMALYNLPAGTLHQEKAIMPLSMGNLVDEIVARGIQPPRVHLDEFQDVLHAVLKVENMIAEGHGIPDLVNHTPPTPAPDMPKLVDFTPRQIRQPRQQPTAIRQFCSGTPVSLTDESSVYVAFSSFSFPFAGNTYNGLYIDSNGYITFGGTYQSYQPNAYRFFNSFPAAIAPYWVDLNPGAGGTITYDEVSSTEFVVCWEDVPRYGAASELFSFSIHLFSNGNYTIYWDRIDNMGNTSSGPLTLVAVTPGGTNTTACGDWDFSMYDGMTLGDGFETRWYDYPFNDFYFLDGLSVDFVGNPAANAPYDHYQANNRMSSAYHIPDMGGMADFATLDGTELTPGEVRWFVVNIPAGGLYYLYAQVWSWNLLDVNYADTVLGVFDADGQLVAFNDDMGSGNSDSEVGLYLSGGRYYIAASAYPDDTFSGFHSETGAIGVTVQYYDSTGIPLPLGDDDYIPVILPFDFPFVDNWNTIFVGSNGFITMLAGSTDLSEDQYSLETGPPRIAAWWDDLDPRDAYYPYGIYVFPYADAALIWWYGVPDYAGTYVIDSAIWIYDDGTFEIYNYATTMDGLTGYGLGVGYPGGPTDLAKEVQYKSVPDEQYGGEPIIGTGWELYMYQIFTAGPITVPELVYYMGCYPYEFMTYDLQNDTYIYMRYPDRFRVMSRGATSGFYLSEMYDPFCMYTPGDNILHFTVEYVMADFHARGWFSVDYPWGYGAAVGHNHGVPWTCLGY
jgi:hypothetical protein